MKGPRIPRIRGDQRGTALIVAIVMTIIFVGFSLALLSMAIAHSTDAITAQENLKALFAAEAGLNEAIADLNRGGPGNVVGTVGGVPFDARAVPVGDRYLIDSVGNNQNWSRAVRTVVAPALPVPVNRAAIMIVGPVGEAAALDTSTANNANILINGGQLPALGVQDPDALQVIVEDLVPKIVNGSVSDNTFRGTPEELYTASNGDQAELPIAEMPAPEWDAEKLEALRQGLLGKIEGTLIPAATTVYGPGAANFTESTTLGPGITLIDGTSMTANANVNGSGTLIIYGGTLEVTRQFHWNGNVIILGDERGGAQFLNNGGTVTVDGNVIVMGNDGSGADFTIGGTAGGNSNTNIHGASILMAGASPNDTAYLEIGSGGVNLHGYVGVFGGAAQISATNQTGVVNILGSMTVGVDGSRENDGFAEIALQGNVHVQFNETHLANAVDGLLEFVDFLQLPPPTFDQVGWLEISPLVAYLPPPEALNYVEGTPVETQSGSPSASVEPSSTDTSAQPSDTTTSSSTGGDGSLTVGGSNGKGNDGGNGKGSGS